MPILIRQLRMSKRACTPPFSTQPKSAARELHTTGSSSVLVRVQPASETAGCRARCVEGWCTGRIVGEDSTVKEGISTSDFHDHHERIVMMVLLRVMQQYADSSFVFPSKIFVILASWLHELIIALGRQATVTKSVRTCNECRWCFVRTYNFHRCKNQFVSCYFHDFQVFICFFRHVGTLAGAGDDEMKTNLLTRHHKILIDREFINAQK